MICHLVGKHAAADKPVAEPGKLTPDRFISRYQLTPNIILDVNLKDGRLMVGITKQPTQEVFMDSPTKWSYRGVDAKRESLEYFHLTVE